MCGRLLHAYLKAINCGKSPTGTVATTVLVAVLITERLLLTEFTTYAEAPFGLTATPYGPPKTNTVATTVLVAGLLPRQCVGSNRWSRKLIQYLLLHFLTAVAITLDRHSGDCLSLLHRQPSSASRPVRAVAVSTFPSRFLYEGNNTFGVDF